MPGPFDYERRDPEQRFYWRLFLVVTGIVLLVALMLWFPASGIGPS